MFGLFLLLAVAFLGGLIAFVGDRVGMRVGRKRLSLFGLRPKYTSMIIAVMTGVLAATSSLGISSIVSENVRIALFHLGRLKKELAVAQERNARLKEEYRQVTAAFRRVNDQWQAAQKQLEEATTRLAFLTTFQKRVEKELEETRRDLTVKTEELQRLEAEYAQAKAAREAAEREVKLFQQRKENLENALTILENQIETLSAQRDYLGTGVLDFATRPIIIRAGEVLAAAVVRPGTSFPEIERLMTSLVNRADGVARERGAALEGKSIATKVEMKKAAEAYQTLLHLEKTSVLRIVARTNVVVGRPAVIYPEVLPDEVIFRRGERVVTVILEGEQKPEAIFIRLVGTVCEEGRKVVAEKGMVDLEGEIPWPSFDLEVLWEIATQAAATAGRREVRFLAAADLHRAGTDLALTPVLVSEEKKK